MIGGSLYWSLRPAVLPNPGISAYRPPAAPPVLARKRDEPDDADRLRLSIAAAAAENERLGLGDGHALAAADPAPQRARNERTTSERAASRPKQRQRGVQQAKNREEFFVGRSFAGRSFVGRSWAARDSFGFWFR